MMLERYSALLGIAALWIAASACRPVIAIGWPELIILVIIIAVLLGPLIYRLYRFIEKIQKAGQNEEKKKR